ncbi:PREDICTED: uncharacterized protein LOC109234649 [Nicotiana attenuata]|uniref:uncharacterized protein LOC109234649 n=1 Tax=Nicotiana attenuata TaxID=49451 RepID=UPI00090597B0|nr:PREDICTED: uncharacterized protein LOC109234649 [Nicotiana attenuata]
MVNGEPTDPFNAAKGLGQGEPISPSMLAISMVYLSRNLKVMAEKKAFHYYPRCAKLEITHLYFADLLIFSRGDVSSVTEVQHSFNQFSKASGLQANLGKRSIYFGGVPQAEQELIPSQLRFTKGALPFKYLGVPLSTKKLILIQWQPLIEKIVARLHHGQQKNYPMQEELN